MSTYTWTVTDESNNKASLRFTPPVTGSPVYDFSNIRVGDTLVILGPEFAIGNRGGFSIESVDIANRKVEFSNKVAETETINLATEAASLDKVSFWRAPVKSVYDTDNPAYVTTEAGNINGIACRKSKVSLPVNTNIVSRNSSNAAYLSEPETGTATVIEKLPDGTTVFTASGYTKTSGHVEISGFMPKLQATSDYIVTPGTPATPGSPVGETDSSQFTHAFTDTYYKGCGATTVTDLKGRVAVIGGRDIETDADINAISVYTPSSITEGTSQGISHTYTWDFHDEAYISAHISGVGTAAVVIDHPRFWNQILIVGGYPLGPDSTPGAGFTQIDSFLYSIDANRLTEVTYEPDPYPADCALVWTGEFALAIGGILPDASISTYVSIWDPSYADDNSLGFWYKSPENFLLEARTECKAITLDDGKVLVIGGRRTIDSNSFSLFNIGIPLNTCELITPDTTFATATVKTGQMTYTRFAFGMVKLPDGRILVVGGCGGKPCEPIITWHNQNAHELSSCEIYDPSLGYWSPIPDTLEPHSYCNCSYDSINNRVYVVGGATSTKVEYLDIESMTWHFSTAELGAVSYRTSGAIIDGDCPILLRAGGSYFNALDQEKNASQATSVTIYNEIARGNGVNGVHKITASNTFVSNPGFTKSQGNNTVTTVTAQESDIKGPYLFDNNQVFGIKGITLTSETNVPKGRGCPSLTITEDITNIDQVGYFVAKFGQKDQVGPIKYTRISAYKIQPDPHFEFPWELLSGFKISLVEKGSYEPSEGSFYLTASNAGLEAARTYITDISAGGIDLDIEVRYPGDRGLGDEGKPVKGASKLSDIIEVFGPDDLDTFLEGARNE